MVLPPLSLSRNCEARKDVFLSLLRDLVQLGVRGERRKRLVKFSESDVAQRWLGCFSSTDRVVAAALLDEMLLVSGAELTNGITQLFDQIMAERERNQPLAFYSEREITRGKTGIHPIFPGSRHGRAVGNGPQPIPFDPVRPEVGSEGIIANLVTSYCRKNHRRTLNHPGPDKLRKHKAGLVVVVADFIGSGKRVWEMLEAFRAVASVRSWRSYHLLDFYVVAYSGTENGIRKVRSNCLRPTVLTVAGCPTIDGAFRKAVREDVKKLCQTFPPNHNKPLGFGAAGALIAFEHGVPNNAPPILHSRQGQWTPLFCGRSTVSAIDTFTDANRNEVAERAERLLRISNAADYLSSARGRRWIKTMLVLSAVDSGARTTAQISALTRIKLETVREIVTFTEIVHWTTRKLSLSDLGRSELQRLRRRRSRTPILPKSDKPFYYPTQLRAR